MMIMRTPVSIGVLRMMDNLGAYRDRIVAVDAIGQIVASQPFDTSSPGAESLASHTIRQWAMDHEFNEFDAFDVVSDYICDHLTTTPA